jgi:hypothetical protein
LPAGINFVGAVMLLSVLLLDMCLKPLAGSLCSDFKTFAVSPMAAML